MNRSTARSPLRSLLVVLLLTAPACGDGTGSRGPDAAAVEAVIAGSYRSWYRGHYSVRGPGLALSAMAFQHSSTAPDHGMTYSQLPRVPLVNATGHAHYGNLDWVWQQQYATIASVRSGMQGLADPRVEEGLSPNGVARARIFGKLVQGLAHADVALLYDRGFVIDESVTVSPMRDPFVELGEPVGYPQVMTAALGYLAQAAALAQAAPPGITIPAAWMGTPADVPMATLAQLALSYSAIYRSAVARTPPERAAVNWNAVLSELAAGLRTDFTHAMGVAGVQWLGEEHVYTRAHDAAWQQATYFVMGMADGSTRYQQWLALPLASRAAAFPSSNAPVLIVSADKRFPQGATLAAQVDAWGTQVGIRRQGQPPGATVDNGGQFTRPENGTWRWSQYFHRGLEGSGGGRTGTEATVRYSVLRLLAAEAHFRLGSLQAAADSINVSRVGIGMLPPATAAGIPVSSGCVPKLPNGSCGSLFEALKWEKRMQGWMRGPFAAGWYFDARGWRDLYRGTPLQLPIGAGRLQPSGQSVYTFGGVGGSVAAPVSGYAYPGE
jgi:hypothetical protein